MMTPVWSWFPGRRPSRAAPEAASAGPVLETEEQLGLAENIQGAKR